MSYFLPQMYFSILLFVLVFAKDDSWTTHYIQASGPFFRRVAAKEKQGWKQKWKGLCHGCRWTSKSIFKPEKVPRERCKWRGLQTFLKNRLHICTQPIYVSFGTNNWDHIGAANDPGCKSQSYNIPFSCKMHSIVISSIYYYSYCYLGVISLSGANF